jgi:hypothetical protein
MAIEARPFTNAPWATIGEVTTFADTVGTIAQEEVDVAYTYTHIDAQFTAGGCAVDTFSDGYGTGKGMNGGLFFEFKKALTANTFAGARLTELFLDHMGNKPLVAIFAGFTF